MVGIDRYRTWPTLDNAVSDAQGALAVFGQLGFAPLTPPLFNEAATVDAIRRLVTDDLATLGGNDSLVLFFAGHGHTQTRTLPSGSLQTGYIIPADGDRPEGRTASWLRLDTWLSDVSRIPARHILVILDACHSGIALGSLIKWRGGASARPAGALDELRRRQSRRVITSALGNQRAMDSGPIQGHSLFTGCLIEGLTGGLARDGRLEATGSEIGLYVQQRVTSYTGSQQTPDFGTLELDDRGEIVLPIAEVAPLPLYAASPADARQPSSLGTLELDDRGEIILPIAEETPTPPYATSPADARQPSDFGMPGLEKHDGFVVPAATDSQPQRLRTARVAFTEPLAARVAFTEPLAAPAADYAPAKAPWHVEFAQQTAVPFAPEAWHKVPKEWSRDLQALGVIVTLVFFAPAGIGLSWALKLWSKRTRVIASTASAIFFIFVVVSGIDDKRKAHEAATQASITAKPVSLADTKPASSPTAANASPPRDAASVQAVTAGKPDSSAEAKPEQQIAAAAKASSPITTTPLPLYGPDCTDVRPNLGKFPGLLPPGIPASAMPHLTSRDRGSSPGIPVLVDGELFSLETVIQNWKLGVSRHEGAVRKLVQIITLPAHEGLPSSYAFDMAVGEKVIGLAGVVDGEAFLLRLDKKTWRVLGWTPLLLDLKRGDPVHAVHLAAGGGAFGIAVQGEHLGSSESPTWEWVTVDENGRARLDQHAFFSSHYVEPRVVWTGSNFVVLAGRTKDLGPLSLGAYVMPSQGIREPAYMPWIEANENEAERHAYDVGGALLWEDGMLHVAMKSSLWANGRHETVAQIVHADLEGHASVERCPTVSLENE